MTSSAPEWQSVPVPLLVHVVLLSGWKVTENERRTR